MNKVKHLFIVGVVAYIFFSTPNGLVIDEKGQIDGVTNNIRSFFQGERFWEAQLLACDEDLKWYLDEPKRQAQIEKDMEDFSKKAKMMDQEFYQKNPDLKPTASQLEAERLRELADEIEEKEAKEIWEKERVRMVSELRKTCTVIRAKLK